MHALGTERDSTRRVLQKREDEDARKKKIETARRSIYLKNYSVNAKVVENQLKPTSLVPAQVSVRLLPVRTFC